ncbi:MULTISPECIES: NAD-dependent epimerase/dehydratase family protein [Gordonia]|uniref:NAD-dependent epimerase/dehydratase family protein n=1 Tax=Gordonia amicalis TaxID=89053 RepID=A0ABU4DA82_9ACTN|nr:MULTISPECIES: NAD-dependent epimerase/dehydratase family protein [Gordonia]ATD72040.1 epimerase [Gordonia sp. 1D]MDJ0451779.1 NAD-dependent epimerase/dehydratase family protein [Gordonia amicalis]MDV6306636.1 NAD-dependent epimerase/dehydratase family protein [Gordonia amicalis]MDV7075526.1 NAD-dependent epimerase/dehydratase family protein [Gordonia amicalis]
MKLVIGGNGFLGSRLVRRLVENGDDVRVLTRATSDLRTLSELDFHHVTGDLFDQDSVRAAMAGCDVVFHCAVDTRAWLRDPAPLYRTNVDGLRAVLDVAARQPLRKFVFTSSVATIGRVEGRRATEGDAFNWSRHAPEYVRSRVAAENLLLDYARDGAVPGVAMCVANTYGAGDWQPTPHGSFVAGAALGKMPFTVRGCRAESVGIDDAARALALAADRGEVGERYIVSERSIDMGEIVAIAARAAGREPPRLVLRRAALYGAGAVGSARAAITRRPVRLTVPSVRLMHFMSEMDHSKAERDLNWRPRPVTEAIEEGARFWMERRVARRS